MSRYGALRYQGLQRKCTRVLRRSSFRRFGCLRSFGYTVRSKNWEGWRRVATSEGLQELRRRWRRIRSQHPIKGQTAANTGVFAWAGGSCPVPCPYMPSAGYSIFTLQGSPSRTKNSKQASFLAYCKNSRSDRYGAGGRASGRLHARQTIQLIDTHRSINGFTLLYVIPPTAP